MLLLSHGSEAEGHFVFYAYTLVLFVWTLKLEVFCLLYYECYYMSSKFANH